MTDPEIIYLEVDEEIPAIIEKIKKAKAREVRLVVPRAAIILQSVINLRLLAKEAVSLDKDIALVTSDSIGRNLASQVGLTLYDHIDDKDPVVFTKHQLPNTSEISEIDLNDEDQPKPTIPVHHFQDVKAQGDEVEDDPVPAKEDSPSGVAQPAEPTPKPHTYHSIDESIIGQGQTTSRPGWVRRHKKPLIIISIVVALVLIAGYILIPTATVTLQVLGETVTKQATLTVATKDKLGDVASDKNPLMGTLLSAKKDSSSSFNATGQKNIGSKAKGTITLYNSWSQDPQSFSAGVRLTKDGKTFTLSSDVKIPGATLTLNQGNVVTNPGTIDATIIATDPGDDSNVVAGKFTIMDIDKGKQSTIYGQSNAALTGGTTTTVNVVSAEDLANAKNKVAGDTLNVAKTDLKKQADNAKLLLLDSAIEPSADNPTSSSNEGDQVNQFTISDSLTVKALVFSEDDFRKAFIAAVLTSLPSDKTLALSDKDEISTKVSEQHYDQNKILLNATITTTLSPKYTDDEIRGILKGKSIAKARTIIGNDQRFEGVSFEFKPTWLGQRLPIIGRNIKVVVVQKQP